MSGKPRVAREALQERTRALYAEGLGCRAIAATLNEDPANTYKRLARLGLVRSREEAYTIAHATPDVPLPFKRGVQPVNLRAAAIGEAARWFLERGYVPSIPLEPTRYDLIVESDDGLKRVQVKTTSFKSEGVWQVHVHRTMYDASSAARGTAGKRRSVAYTPQEVDLFFIVTGDGTRYLLPISVIGETKQLSLGKKYEGYKI